MPLINVISGHSHLKGIVSYIKQPYLHTHTLTYTHARLCTYIYTYIHTESLDTDVEYN